MSLGNIPVVDLSRRTGGDRRLPADVDVALQEVGFLMVEGHGVEQHVIDEAREAARGFFHEPVAVKQAVAVDDAAYRGWIGMGAESNAATYGVETLPDLKETFVVGSLHGDGDGDEGGDAARWFQPNRWPQARPELRTALERYFHAMAEVADHLLGVFSDALGLPAHYLGDFCRRPVSSLDANWYPSHRIAPATGEHPQFRVGPHTDFGTITILDREPGAGGLQVQTLDDRWIDAPYVPGTFTVNIGDLMSRWTNGRWRSTRHRVLPPPVDAPDEELLSLVFFHGADHDAVIEAVPTCVGPGHPDPPPAILYGDYVGAKIDALATT